MIIPDEKIKQLQIALQDGDMKGSVECYETALDLHHIIASDMVELISGVMVPSAVKEVIHNYLINNQKIRAIKAYRCYNKEANLKIGLDIIEEYSKNM